jgi:hypothetical protein
MLIPMDPAVAANWVAAGAAYLAAGVIAWQSWEVRRSANASHDALVTANDALNLSRQQVSEAIRARIDAAMPTILVQAGEPIWPPLEPAQFLGNHPQPLPFGVNIPGMHMPRDQNRQIMVRTEITLTNDSTRHVQMITSPLVDGDDEPLPNPLRFGPGERITGNFSVVRSLAGWVQICEEREAGRPGEEAIFDATYLDPADTGATDHWHVAVGGCPVERISDLQGGWQLIAAPSALSGKSWGMGVGSSIRQRTYWLSKTKNLPLPETV